MNEILQQTLMHEIPLTQAMGLRVEEASGQHVRLAFPLEPNHNHKHTAFGGSLYSAAVLAGWSLLWCALREREIKAQVVIAGSSERFMRPVATDFTAECSPDPAAIEAAFKMLARKGKARVELETVVFCQGEACVAFRGSYGLLGQPA